jgi:hypothetical protein
MGTLPFAAIAIPKIMTIGPQVSISSAASIYVDAHGEFRAGARFFVSAGEVVLNATASANHKATGFETSVTPIFEVKNGSMVATADLAIPVGVEIALDVLGGTWKNSIGVYTAPSLYFTAGVSSGEGKKCDNELSFVSAPRIEFIARPRVCGNTNSPHLELRSMKLASAVSHECP